jgi:effector-binding domain-containing protein
MLVLDMIRSLIVFLFLSGGLMAIEEPRYILESRDGSLEVRNYEQHLVAEVQIKEDFDSAGNSAFSILASYIFGNNTSKSKITMTSPVIQSEKIAMTAPVSQLRSEVGYLVQFTMPEQYTLETLPEPNDKRVTVLQIPAKKMAVWKYSGSWSKVNFDQQLEKLLVTLQHKKIEVKGQPIFARFNSPFQIWFLRRNEIWLEIEGSGLK